MIEVVRINVTYTGYVWKARWDIPAEAHALGLAAAHGTTSVLVGDRLGTSAAAGDISTHLYRAVEGVARELGGAWGTAPMF